jgi:hypothetical protein
LVLTGRMASYHVTIFNEHFSQEGEQQARDAAEAQQKASAISIGGEQVCGGRPYFGVEVIVDDGTKLVGRYVDSGGATPLRD